MSEQHDDNGNGFPTEEETRSGPGPEEPQIDPDRIEKDEGFPIEAET